MSSRVARLSFVSLIAAAAVPLLMLLMPAAASAGAQPHMTPVQFPLVSLTGGQTARLNVSIASGELVPAVQVASVTLSFDVYEIPPGPQGRDVVPAVARFISRSSSQVTLRTGEAASLNFTVPGDGSVLIGAVVIGNPGLTPANSVSLNSSFEVREGLRTLFLVPAVMPDCTTPANAAPRN